MLKRPSAVDVVVTLSPVSGSVSFTSAAAIGRAVSASRTDPTMRRSPSVRLRSSKPLNSPAISGKSVESSPRSTSMTSLRRSAGRRRRGPARPKPSAAAPIAITGWSPTATGRRRVNRPSLVVKVRPIVPLALSAAITAAPFTGAMPPASTTCPRSSTSNEAAPSPACCADAGSLPSANSSTPHCRVERAMERCCDRDPTILLRDRTRLYLLGDVGLECAL